MKRIYWIGALAVVAAFVAGCNSTNAVPGPSNRPAAHRIEHVIVMVQENRSFNNLFMGFPGADTATTGRCKNENNSAPWCPKNGVVPIKPVPLEEGRIIGGLDDIDHTHKAFETECDPDAANVCRNDGFDLINYGEAGSFGAAKLFPYSYVDRSETKPYWDLASQYTLADHMFFTDTAASFVAHQEIIAGTVRLNSDESLTNQPNNQPWGCDAPGPHSGPSQFVFTPVIYKDGKVKAKGPFPCFTQYRTMADLLDPANTTWKFYVDSAFGKDSDFSGAVWNGFDAIRKVRYGPDWHTNVRRPNTTIFTDIENGTLPEVSWVIPSLCASDHPASGANRGPKWVTRVVNAIGTSKYWSDSAIVILWDDWGGWYDNVPPPQVNYTSLGFRVPMIVVSPYAKPHYVTHTAYDFGSVLKFIEQTFNLGSLGTTDATANSMLDAFDFSQRPNAFKPAALPHVRRCPRGAAAREIIESDGGAPE